MGHRLAELRRRRRVSVAACALVVLSTGYAVVGGGSSAGAVSSYDGVAVGDLARHVVHAQPMLVEDLADVGAVTSQVRVTSAGDSIGFASTPYPGALLLTVPGLVGGALRLPASAPGYPFIASSSYPATPRAQAQAGSVELRAESDERWSKASARDGGNRTRSSVTADADETVVAEAETLLEAAQFGQSFSAGGVHSTATVTRRPGGPVIRKTSFAVASMNVLGQQMRYIDGQFELAGVKAPAGDATKAVNDLLARLQESGTTVRVVQPEETKDGVYSAALEVKREVDMNGTVVTVTSTYGRSYAAVTNRELAGGDGGGDDDGNETVDDGTTDVNTGGETQFDDVVTSPASPSTLSALSDPPVSASPTASEDTRAPALLVASSMAPETAPAGRFYPILIFAGACLVAAFNLFRKWGVRLTWIS